MGLCWFGGNLMHENDDNQVFIWNPLDLQDYCMEDGFNAECPAGEILLMEEAFYGRMEFGTCLKYAVGNNCER